MKTFPRKSNGVFLNLFLIVLMPVIYSRSKFLAMTLLSMYGLVHGVACVPRKRASAVKSLLCYGRNVTIHGLDASDQSSYSRD